MPSTYEPIATISLGGSNTATFSSIPSTYTDLRVILLAKHPNQGNILMTFNGDTGLNYSSTSITGDGTTAASRRQTNASSISVQNGQNLSATEFGFLEVNIFSYAGSTNKTALYGMSGEYNARHEVNRGVGLWRNTSAITSIGFTIANSPFDSGSTATLYGILKA